VERAAQSGCDSAGAQSREEAGRKEGGEGRSP
jgi:hypothetical protein